VFLKISGEMAEWLNAAVLKTVKDASPSGVRIPVSPQNIKCPAKAGYFFIPTLKACFQKDGKNKRQRSCRGI
jgi:hypothetical protein